MDAIVTQILAGVLIAVFVALFTYYLTTRSKNEIVEKVVSEAFRQHAQVYHKKSVSEMLQESEEKLQKRFDNDLSKEAKRIDELNALMQKLFDKVDSIRTSQAFIVGRLGGEPKDYDLGENT